MAPTKTTAVAGDWAQQAAAAIREIVYDCSGQYGTVLGIALCHDSVNAHANGVMVRVEWRAGADDDDWILLREYRTSGGTANSQALAAASGPGEANAERIEVAATANFDTKMDRHFLRDAGDVTLSEIVTNNGIVTNDYIIALNDLVRNHDSADTLYDIIDDTSFTIPNDASTARVLIWNDDADCTICSKVTVGATTSI